MAKKKPTSRTVIEQQADILNEVHNERGAGFYGRGVLGDRYFGARAELVDGKQQLQITPDHGRTWQAVPEGASFVNYWNTNIVLPTEGEAQ